MLVACAIRRPRPAPNDVRDFRPRLASSLGLVAYSQEVADGPVIALLLDVGLFVARE
jgi:hypothetical protein